MPAPVGAPVPSAELVCLPDRPGPASGGHPVEVMRMIGGLVTVAPAIGLPNLSGGCDADEADEEVPR